MCARFYTAMCLAAVMAATPALLPAQRQHRDDDDDASSRIDTTVALSAGGVVELSLISGEIKVTSWNRDQVRVHATSEEGLLQFDASNGRVSLSVRSQHGNMGDTEYQVTIPAGARLITHSVSADITTDGGSDVEARSVSGDVAVSNATGRATIESVSGGLKARNVGRGLRASTVSGDVEANDITGDIDAQSTSGDIVLSGTKSSFVHTQTVSGETRFGGTVDRAGRYEFHSHSGDIQLAVPSTGVTFDVNTFSGDLQSDYPMTLQPGSEVGHKHMEFSINGGGARVTAETFSGDITVERPGHSHED
ncbi:MAG TPA: DUF4097 family beta strand repeat-containing protein [Gemmatimonadaceae bacterium]|nr:DUF4097 family beta strand repeat-containing protein [Gemmatimonadaceae bacterium]